MSLRSIVIAAMLLLVSACSATPASPPPTSSAPPAVFPVTVKHAFGEATVPKKPERVVALGWTDVAVANRLDAPIAGAARFPDGANLPYVDAQLSQEVLGLDPANPDLAKVTSYQPDLILAVGVVLDAARYEQLAKIAPTVARSTQASTMDEDAELIGAAVGNPAGARRLIDTAHAELKGLQEELPKLPGKSYFHAEALPFLDSLGLRRAADAGSADIDLDAQPAVIQLLRQPNVAGVEWLLEQLKPTLRKVS